MLKKCILVIVMTVLLTVALSSGASNSIWIRNGTDFAVTLTTEKPTGVTNGWPVKDDSGDTIPTPINIPPHKILQFDINADRYYVVLQGGHSLGIVGKDFWKRNETELKDFDIKDSYEGGLMLMGGNQTNTTTLLSGVKKDSNLLIRPEFFNENIINSIGDSIFFWNTSYYLGKPSNISALSFYKMPDNDNQYLLLGTSSNGFGIGIWDKSSGVLLVDGFKRYNTTTPNCSLPSNDITAVTVVSIPSCYTVAVIGTSKGLMIARLDGATIIDPKTYYLLGHSISTVEVFHEKYIVVTGQDAVGNHFIRELMLPLTTP